MNKLIAAVAGPALMSAASMTHALGLGDIRASSALGSPLQAEIALIGRSEERLDEKCFRFVKPRDGGDMPWISRGNLSLRQGAASQTLLLTTAEVVREPIVQIAVRVSCGAEITREYTLLLSPPLVPPTASTPATRPPPQVSPTAGKPVSGPAVGTWSPVGGESLDSAARTLYPHSRRMQRAFIKGVLAANPVLGGDSAAPIAAGSLLTMPDMRALTRPPAAVKATSQAGDNRMAKAPAPLPSSSPSVARPRSSELQRADKLVLGGGDSAEVDAVLRLKLSTELLRLASADDIPEQRRNMLRMEYRLIVQLNEQARTQLEVVERMRELESTMGELRALAQQLADGGASESRPVEPVLPLASAPATAPVVTTPTPRASTEMTIPEREPSPAREDGAGWFEWLFFGGLAVAIAGVLGYVGFNARRRRQEENAIGWYGGHAPESSSLGADADARSVFRTLVPVPATTADQPFVDTAALPDTSEPKPLPTAAQAARIELQDNDDTATEVFEEHSVVELADIMLAFGRTKGAAEMLHEHIVANPKEALAPWFKLLEIYRQSGLRMEFENVSMRLHKNFNVKVEDWDAVSRGPAPAESLEAFPHVIRKISQHWRQPDCDAYLRKLLEDNRDGQRVGFPRAVAEEINLLLEVLGQSQSSGRADQP